MGHTAARIDRRQDSQEENRVEGRASFLPLHRRVNQSHCKLLQQIRDTFRTATLPPSAAALPQLSNRKEVGSVLIAMLVAGNWKRLHKQNAQ